MVRCRCCRWATCAGLGAGDWVLDLAVGGGEGGACGGRKKRRRGGGGGGGAAAAAAAARRGAGGWLPGRVACDEPGSRAPPGRRKNFRREKKRRPATGRRAIPREAGRCCSQCAAARLTVRDCGICWRQSCKRSGTLHSTGTGTATGSRARTGAGSGPPQWRRRLWPWGCTRSRAGGAGRCRRAGFCDAKRPQQDLLAR